MMRARQTIAANTRVHLRRLWKHTALTKLKPHQVKNKNNGALYNYTVHRNCVRRGCTHRAGRRAVPFIAPQYIYLRSFKPTTGAHMQRTCAASASAYLHATMHKCTHIALAAHAPSCACVHSAHAFCARRVFNDTTRCPTVKMHFCILHISFHLL